MTTITQLREIVEHVRSLPNKNMKSVYLNQQSRETLNFLGKNIRMDSIGKTIASEMLKFPVSESSMEHITAVFRVASGLSGRLDKIKEMKDIVLSPADREFVLECLYGSIKLGITVPIPNPIFGEPISPQLCGTGIEFNAKEYIIEEKFDGHRCIGMNIDGKIKLYTRGGKPLVAEAITTELADAIPPGFVLDGELVAASGEFADLKRHTDEIEYRVFDMPFHMNNDITDIPFHARRTILEECLHETNRIRISPILHLKNMYDINRWIERNSAEGIIAKDPTSPYLYGGRKSWIKVKPVLDISGWIVGWSPGEGKRSDGIGAVEFRPDGFTATTFVGTGFNDNDLELMKSWINLDKQIRITVKYQNVTKDNRLRFPVFMRVDEVI